MQQLLKLPSGTIPYTLKISAKRRTIGLRIDDHGLTVHIPKRIHWPHVEQLLLEKSAWIIEKLSERENRPEPVTWQDGTTLFYLGEPISLSLRQDVRNRQPVLDGETLIVAQPDITNTAMIQRKVSQWFAKQAIEDFRRRVELLAAKLGVPMPSVFLSNAKTRWGSCNSRGEIRLHWRLIQAPPHIIQYVVAHELAHLKEMNHSPKFWAWVEKLCPEYAKSRNELKAMSADLHLV